MSRPLHPGTPSRTVSTRLPAASAQQIHQLAKRNNVSTSHLIRDGLALLQQLHVQAQPPARPRPASPVYYRDAHGRLCMRDRRGDWLVDATPLAAPAPVKSAAKPATKTAPRAAVVPAPVVDPEP